MRLIPPVQTEPPPISDLHSTDAAVRREAWNRAYPLLWEAGQRVAWHCLRGPEWAAQRDDLVATALGQLVVGAEDFCNAAAGFDDLVGVLKNIVRRRTIDFLRQQARRPEVLVANVPDSPIAPRADDATEVWAEVARLDPPLPDLFTDRFVLGWTTTEIAARRQMNVNTVLSHFHRGFRALRERLTDFQP